MNLKLITAKRMFDGESLIAFEGQGILIRDGLIKAIGSVEELAANYTDAVFTDYGEATILPGLIDSHVHLTMPGDGADPNDCAQYPMTQRHEIATANLAKHTRCGVTTMRDLGSHEDLLSIEFPEDQATVLRAGPPLTADKGHMYFFGGGSPLAKDAIERLERNIALGAHVVKMVATGGGTLGTVPHETTLTIDWMTEVVERASQNQMVVTTHALSSESVKRAILAGSDGIEHLSFLEDDGSDSVAPPADLMKLAQENQTYFGTTLSVNYKYIAMAEAGLVDTWDLEDQKVRTSNYLRGARHLYEAGCNLVAASDAGWKVTPFGEFGMELELLVKAGLKPVDALIAATSKPAQYLNLPERGHIGPGKRADLLVVAGNPVENISDIKNVQQVFVSGAPVI